MPVDASAVARTLGIETVYEDLRVGAVVTLPQRLMVIAQGTTAAAGYTTTKFTPTSALEVGNVAGFGSPAHLAALEIWPPNGDGIGTIPADFVLLVDGTTEAAGDITPSGTTTAVSTYWVLIGGILSAGFAIAKGAIDVSLVCKDMGQAISAISAMPVTQGWTYDTVTSADPAPANTGTGTVTVLAATTAIPGDWTLVCTSASVDNGVFTLTDPDGTVVSTTVTAAVAPGTDVDEGGLQFKLTAINGSDFIVGDDFVITVPALTVTVESKWKGISANDIEIVMVDPLGDLTFALTQPTGGAVNPTVDAALAQVGNVWNTMFLNGLNIADTTALGAYDVFGEGRWGELVHKPCIVFTGVTNATVAAATAVSDARTTDRTNSQLVAPGSKDLPIRVAARELARIVKLANNVPPHDYGSQKVDGINPGTDAQQWTHPQRDQAVKAGSSTVEVRDSVIYVSDVVTFYHPSGDQNPAYRYVVDVVKLQQCIFNTALIFNTTEWDGAPLIPDDQATTEESARKPSGARAELAALADNLADKAIISDAAATKSSITAVINSQNAKRLDTEMTYAVSGNANIISHKQKFGFFYGGASA